MVMPDLGSSLARDYALWAARCEVPIEALSVALEEIGDADGGSTPLAGDLPCVSSRVRVVVTVESRAPERDVCDALRLAEEHSRVWRGLRARSGAYRETWFARPRD